MTNNNKPQKEPETTVTPSSAAVTPRPRPTNKIAQRQSNWRPRKPWTAHQLKLRSRNQTRKGKVGKRGVFGGVSAQRRFYLCASAAKVNLTTSCKLYAQS